MERVFIQENVAFNLSVTQLIPASNEQMMKTNVIDDHSSFAEN